LVQPLPILCSFTTYTSTHHHHILLHTLWLSPCIYYTHYTFTHHCTTSPRYRLQLYLARARYYLPVPPLPYLHHTTPPAPSFPRLPHHTTTTSSVRTYLRRCLPRTTFVTLPPAYRHPAYTSPLPVYEPRADGRISYRFSLEDTALCALLTAWTIRFSPGWIAIWTRPTLRTPA